MSGARHDPRYPAATIDLGLRTSRPPAPPARPVLRAFIVIAASVVAVLGGLALAALLLASGEPAWIKRDMFGHRIVNPLSAGAGGLLALGGIGGAIGARVVVRQQRARRALRAWAEREGFTLRGPDEAATAAGGGTRVRILYRAASLGEATGFLVALPRGWMSDVSSFAGTTEEIGRRIDAIVTSARQRDV